MDRVNFLLNAMEIIPQADVLASLRLFAREVMPAFRDAKAGNGGRARPDAALRHPRAARRRRAPARLRDLDTEAWTLPKAEILQLAFEVPARHGVAAARARCTRPFPPTRRSWSRAIPESPVGPFVLAQLRLMARAGAHPRGFVLGAVASTAEAAAALRERWGLPAVPATVTLQAPPRPGDGDGDARDGAPILECALVDPEPISGGDVQYIHSVTLARAPARREDRARA